MSNVFKTHDGYMTWSSIYDTIIDFEKLIKEDKSYNSKDSKIRIRAESLANDLLDKKIEMAPELELLWYMWYMERKLRTEKE